MSVYQDHQTVILQVGPEALAVRGSYWIPSLGLGPGLPFSSNQGQSWECLRLAKRVAGGRTRSGFVLLWC